MEDNRCFHDRTWPQVATLAADRREELAIDVEEAAERLTLSPDEFQAFEAGKRPLEAAELAQLAGLLDLRVGDMLAGTAPFADEPASLDPLPHGTPERRLLAELLYIAAEGTCESEFGLAVTLGFELDGDEVIDMLLDLNLERCPSCGWWSESALLVLDETEEQAVGCTSCTDEEEQDG